MSAVALKVTRREFERAFRQKFGFPPPPGAFEEWCARWGGKADKDECALPA
jgi:hypothetical protein